MTSEEYHLTIAASCAEEAQALDRIARMYEADGAYETAAERRKWAAMERKAEVYHRRLAVEMAAPRRAA